MAQGDVNVQRVAHAQVTLYQQSLIYIKPDFCQAGQNLGGHKSTPILLRKFRSMKNRILTLVAVWGIVDRQIILGNMAF